MGDSYVLLGYFLNLDKHYYAKLKAFVHTFSFFLYFIKNIPFFVSITTLLP